MSHAPHRDAFGTAAGRRPAPGRRHSVGGCAWSWVTAAVACGGCLVAGGRRDSDVPEPTKVTLGRGDDSVPVNRTIPLELSFVRCDPKDELLGEALWQYVDEQALPADLRRRLAANGLRVGVVGSHLPPGIAARFATDVAQPAADPLTTDAPVSRRLMRLLPGRRGEIVTASGIAELVLLEQTGGEVRGGTYREASPLFAVEVEPAADGRVTIEVTPEIRHGPIEKSWVGEDGMFRLEAGQRRHVLEELRFSVTLPHQGLLLVGCGGDGNATAGDCLLRGDGKGSAAGMRVMAIRPLADTIDPLFAPDDEPMADEDEAPLVVR
jgi:hypothetical protein